MGSYGALARLVSPRRLRAMYLAVRHDASGDTFAGGRDGDLVEVAATPFESVADALDRLDRLETLLRRREDRRAVFLTIYATMTRAVDERIGSGRFRNPEWMRAYTRTFANYYREAFLAYERGRVEAVPEPWRIAFDTAARGQALIAQDAFLGISAHINYDLALTLRDVGVDPNRAEKHADHRAIDDILARLVDAQQAALADLYAPGIDDVDATLGRFDEALSLFALTEARAQAWRVGVVLSDTDWRLIERYATWVLRTTAVGAAAFVLSPGLSPEVHRALERVEREQVDLPNALDELNSRLAAVEF